MLGRYLNNEDGVVSVEWTVIAITIAVACIVTLTLVGQHANETFEYILTIY